MPIDNDLLHRFVFDNTDIRGEIVTLQNSINDILNHHNHPSFVEQLIGEFVTAVALLSSTLKFDGRLTLQAQGNGPIPLIIAEIDHNKRVRSTAKVTSHDTPQDTDLPALIGNGVLSITINPDKGNRYQGIVPLEAPTLAGCLERYFLQSEQLSTRIWLTSNAFCASGMLLQRLPQQQADEATNTQAWEERTQLADTSTPEELLTLDHKQLLTRLFHEQGVRFYEPVQLSFGCSCSKQRSSQALKYLKQKDLEQLLIEKSMITVDCQFCGQQYTYNQEDIDQIFAPEIHH